MKLMIKKPRDLYSTFPHLTRFTTHGGKQENGEKRDKRQQSADKHSAEEEIELHKDNGGEHLHLNITTVHTIC